MADSLITAEKLDLNKIQARCEAIQREGVYITITGQELAYLLVDAFSLIAEVRRLGARLSEVEHERNGWRLNARDWKESYKDASEDLNDMTRQRDEQRARAIYGHCPTCMHKGDKQKCEQCLKDISCPLWQFSRLSIDGGEA